MPRLSLDTRLDRLLAESVETTRYTDYSAVVRRLHLGNTNVPVGTKLRDRLDQEWLVGDRDEIDRTLPVATTQAGASRKVAAGELLRDEAGNTYALCADVLMHVGGVWDKQRREFRRGLDGSRDRGKGVLVVDAMESQVQAFRWLSGRLAAFRDRKSHPQLTGMCFDDRRGGKTFFIVVAVILTCLECPTVAESPLEARIVTQTVQSRDEIDEIFKLFLPPGWGHLREQPKRQYTFATGAKVGFLTTDNVDTLLSGRMDVVAINEAALFPRKVFEKTSRATRDRRGFMLVATNTPENPRGNWTTLLIEGAERMIADGLTPPTARLRVETKKNAAVDKDAEGPIALSILHARGDDDSQVDDGIVKEAGAKLFSPPYDPTRHHVPIPQLGIVDITAEFTERVVGRRYDFVCGQDYQWDCTASVWRLMAPGGEWAKMQLWCVWAEWLDGKAATSGDRSLPEDDLLDACEAAGYTAANTLIIPDCSAGSQGSRHKHGIEPPTVEILNRRRWQFDYPSEKRNVDSMHPRNPLEGASNMACRKWIREDRIFVASGDEAYKMHKALVKCDAYVDAKGNLRAKSSWAHLVDSMRYTQWWAQRRLSENPTAVATPQRAVIGRRR
jgi:hypothetical protein